MAGYVRGKNVILSAYITDGFYPFACATNVTLEVNTEQLPTTTNASGAYRTFKSRLNDWKITLDGITVLNSATTKYHVLSTIEQQVRQSGLTVQIIWTDPDGDFKTLEGSVMIPFTRVDSDVNAFSSYSVELLGTGAFSLTSTTPNVGSVFVYTYTAAGGETSFTHADLINRTMLLGFRNTENMAIITGGSPTIDDLKFTAASGLVEFSPAANAGEKIKVCYQ